MRILVTFAVDAEFAPWRRLRDFRKVKVNAGHYSGGVDVFESEIGDNAVWIFLTGIGIKSFDVEAASCLRDAGVSAVLSCGLAGSLSPAYRRYETVSPRRVGSLQDSNGIVLNPHVQRLAEECGVTIIDTLLTIDHIVKTAEEKSRLGPFAQAVDMESLHVASEFSRQKLPVGIVRTISDDSSQDLPVGLDRFIDSHGHIMVAELSKQVLASPSSIPALFRFGRQSIEAAHKLVLLLDRLVQKLTPHALLPEPSEVSIP
jgi:nucleoside phosphorylase